MPGSFRLLTVYFSLFTAYLFCSFAAWGGPVPVVVVTGVSSLGSPNELAYASGMATRVSGWLRGAGVPVTEISDDDVTSGALRGALVAVLPCNPHPGSGERKALRRFLNDGGRLVVCYGADEELAAAMGMKLGAYLPESTPGAWHTLRFGAASPAGAPLTIVQPTHGVKPAFPAEAGARVIAEWENAAGHRTGVPACTASTRGFWLSATLMEGDAAAKQRLLLALLGAMEPGLWRTAAEHAVNESGQAGGFASFDNAVAAVRGAPAAGPATEALLTRSGQARATAAAALRAGQWLQAVDDAGRVDALLVEAFASAQKSCPDEFRGVWNRDGLGLMPGHWPETAAQLARDGITAVLPNWLRPGLALYPSRLIPVSDAVRLHGDQAAAGVAAAHQHGLQVHAWVMCWNLDGAPPDWLARMRRENRLQLSSSGQSIAWLCPSNPEHQNWQRAAIRELATGYAVDGIHLDYIRQRSRDFCFCAGCRSRFETATAARVRHWPGDVISGTAAAAWRDWRRDTISRFVRDLRCDLRALRPGLILSAAVYGSYPSCRDTIGQDWGAWLREGWVDFVAPMNYTADEARFERWTQLELALPGTAGRIYPGLGVTALESRLSPVQTIRQILSARRLGARGFVLYELNDTLGRELLPRLAQGITRR
ncbi:MAG: family 10 glycosylhydrolase [bacterium]